MNNEYFFMVYVEDGTSPTYRHSNLEAAEKEAKRLSKMLGKKAWILCTLKSFEIVEFQVKDCRPEGDLPF